MAFKVTKPYWWVSWFLHFLIFLMQQCFPGVRQVASRSILWNSYGIYMCDCGIFMEIHSRCKTQPTHSNIYNNYKLHEGRTPLCSLRRPEHLGQCLVYPIPSWLDAWKLGGHILFYGLEKQKSQDAHRGKRSRPPKRGARAVSRSQSLLESNLPFCPWVSWVLGINGLPSPLSCSWFPWLVRKDFH